MMKRIAVLGSTGSIGTQTLDVVGHLGDGYRIAALAAGSAWEPMLEQIRSFAPATVGLTDPEAAERLRAGLNGSGTRVLSGPDASRRIAASDEVDIVVSAIVGRAGLEATAAALKAGKTVALANKESLVAGGTLLTRLAREHGGRILPVDSEHSAIFQALQAGRDGEVDRLVITGSGGPFRERPADTLPDATPEEALRHPTWSMGPKITIDSATLMNKGLELIEAKYLFGLPPDRIEILIHPQSIVHSMVAFRDGSVLAQLGLPDMRVPIQYALTYPERRPGPVAAPDLAAIGRLTFEAPDPARFPALELGRRAAETGGTMECVLNAANETAVGAFLEGRIRFTGIPETVARVMDRHKTVPDPDMERIAEADAWARREAERCCTG